MWHGWTGTQLEVDLSQRKIKKTQGDQQMYDDYLGGRGLITRLFWDSVPPEVEPFSPENVIIFGAGTLVGTAAPSACRTAVVTRSPMTNYLFDSNMSGFWGPELKFAGYDTVSVSGKSATPVYIFINNDTVEIRDASHLWGKDIFETQRLIRKELKDEKIQSLCIGPAGENRVYFASIEHGPGCSMSRGGGGAIMGDKKLKAIAVRGSQDISIARPGPFTEVCEDIPRQSAFIDSKEAQRWPDTEKGTLYRNILKSQEGNLYRNYELNRPWKDSLKDYLDFLVERNSRMVACFKCRTPCITAVHLPDGQPIYWKCHSRHRYMAAGDIQDFGFSLRCFALGQRLGIDTSSGSNLCRFAIDLFQKGILNEKDTGGMVLEWGNPEVVPALLEKIAYRRDIGDILADGAYQAAQRIGRGAEQSAYHMRKAEMSGGKLSGITEAVGTIISDRQEDYKRWHLWSYEELVQGAKDAEEVTKWRTHLATAPRDEASVDTEIMARRLAYDLESNILRDSSGLCRNRYSKDDNLKKLGHAFEVEMLAHATGLDLDEDGARKCDQRARALVRAYNAILGERMKAADLDTRTIATGLLADNRAMLSRLVEETNKMMGYNADGIPRRDHLEKLGLSDVSRELERRGILPEPVSIPG